MYFISSIFIDHGYEYAKDSFEKKVKKKWENVWLKILQNLVLGNSKRIVLKD